MKNLKLACILIVVMLIALASSLQTQETAAQEPPPSPTVIRLYYGERENLDSLAAWLDIWEVNPQEGHLTAQVNASEYAALVQDGYRLEIDEKLTRQILVPPGYPCYRTVEEIYADLQQIAAEHPEITDLTAIGESWEKFTPGGEPGYDIWMIRVTNEAITTEKPAFFLMSTIHAREMTTAETAMAYLDYLVDNYGSDPDVTWLVDHHELYVVPMTNPDGRKKAETGAYWRKNTDNDDGCSDPNDWGTDLNRNSSFRWGCCGGSSGSPCAETYRGPGPASEPEVQTIENIVRTIFPDQRGPGDYDPAPEDTTGVLITLHSYSNLVLWPWGWTNTSSPNGPALQTLGQKFASYNGYTPQQSNQLYTTDGTTDDWAYGELGIAAYTFELGETFFQPCDDLPGIIQENMQAFIYAAKSARTPYMTSYGPDALEPAVEPAAVLPGQPVALSATINDTQNGSQTIAAAEFYLDTPPWDGGTPLPMNPGDGAFDETIEPVEAILDTAGLADGRHILFVRGQDVGGHWGPFSAVFLNLHSSQLAGTVTEAGLNALAGAEIDAQRLSDPLVYTTLSLADGGYALSLPAGTYTVTAWHYGYMPETVTGLVIPSGMTVTQDFNLTRLPSGRLEGTVTETGSGAPLAADLVVLDTPLATETDPSTGYYSFTLPAGSYQVMASAPLHSSQTASNVLVEVDGVTEQNFSLDLLPCILLVDDDQNGPDVRSYYTGALDAIGADYAIWDVVSQGDPAAADLSGYTHLIWFIGYPYNNTFTADNQTAVAAFLDNGGNFFLSGQDYLYDVGLTSFGQNYLHIGSYNNDESQTTVTGVNAFAGLGPYALSYPFTNYSDVVNPDGASELTFSGNQGNAAIGYTGETFNTLFFGFPFEAISTPAGRADVMAAAIEFLGGCAPPEPDIYVNPPMLSATLLPNQQAMQSLSIANLGNAPLEFGIGEVGKLGNWEIGELGMVNAGAEFFVVLKEQADLSGAAALATRAEKGRYVYQALTSAAERTQSDLRAYLDAQGVDYRPFWIQNMLLVAAGEDVMSALAARPDVAGIAANPHFDAFDDGVGFQPSLEVETIEWNIARINADDVWNLDYTGQGIVVGSHDTGVEWTHPALSQQYRGEAGNHDYNWFDATGTYPTAPADGHGHGTHTTGTAVGNDGLDNQIGVAPDAQWMACKSITNGGSADVASYITCFEWFLAPTRLDNSEPDPTQAPHVINNSWLCADCDDLLRPSIQALNAAGIMVVKSAGNQGPSCNSITNPGEYPEVLAVGNLQPNETIRPSSSRGPVTVDSATLIKPNLAAPGTDIRSSIPGGDYASSTGTSTAAPHAAGVTALLWSAAPCLQGDPAATQTILQESAEPRYDSQCPPDDPSGRPNNVWGWGVLDAYAAVQSGLDYCGNSGLNWWSAAPVSGTVPAGESLSVTVTLDATDLAPGLYTDTLVISSNDPDEPQVYVPIQLTVAETLPCQVELSIDPAQMTAYGPFTVSVAISLTAELGGFELDLVYDPAVVHVESVDMGPFLENNDRTWVALGPIIDNPAGVTGYGVFSMGTEPGPSGEGAVAIVTLLPQEAGTTTLDIQGGQVTDPAGGSIEPVCQSSGQVTVPDCFRFDFDCDCDVDIVDIMAAASRWQCESGDDCYQPLYDIDDDGDVDIVDIMQTAAWWGWTCE